MHVLDHVVRHHRAVGVSHVDAVVVGAVRDLAAPVNPVPADHDPMHGGISAAVVRQRHAGLTQVVVRHVGIEEPRAVPEELNSYAAGEPLGVDVEVGQRDGRRLGRHVDGAAEELGTLAWVAGERDAGAVYAQPRERVRPAMKAAHIACAERVRESLNVSTGREFPRAGRGWAHVCGPRIRRRPQYQDAHHHHCRTPRHHL